MKRKQIIIVFYRGNQTSQLDQPQNEEETNHEIRIANREIQTTAENQNINPIIRNYQQKHPPTTESTRRRGMWNVEYKIPLHIDLTTLDRELLDYIYKQTLIDFCLIHVATLHIKYWMSFDTS